jgi:toxin ParE1/3/4
MPMTAYRYSKLARLDLIEIGDYTLDQWGIEQALRYLNSLEECFERIAANPGIGRRCDRIREGYRRFEHQKHVIFYRSDPEGVLIVRILHERMLPEIQSMEETD